MRSDAKISNIEEPVDAIAPEKGHEPVRTKIKLQDDQKTHLLQNMEGKTVLSRVPAGYQLDQLTNRGWAESMDDQGKSHAVDLITGAIKASNSQRFRAVSDLHDAELQEADAIRLLDYLKDEKRYTGMSDAAMHVLINEIVAVFHDRHELSEDYLRASKYIISNESEQEVIRDYTLQGLSRGIGNASEEQAEMIKDVFWNSLKATDTSLAGTALLALNRERKTGNLTSEAVVRLGEVIAEFLIDPGVGERTRIAAMQVADSMSLVGLNDYLVSISSGPNTFSERIVIESIRSR